MRGGIPKHLERYIVEQDYSLYSYEDQSVWRFIMRQLYGFLKEHAHPCYSEGLAKTGISLESIPKIADMNEKLNDYGWCAVPVSGFIPPAAFMSFQANRILPIACEIRTMDHILYTPAPDIVHEAAGHAPILIDKDFTNYLSAYGEVASKAIISSEDLALYEAIRDLSDIKESPQSTAEEISQAESHLNKVSQEMSYTSEAQLLGRMNWWTAEYGLIGDLKKPKIYGAGLLSSIGESRKSLTQPKHIDFDLTCLEFSYDITEQQPQLFVAKDFNALTSSLNKMSQLMAFSVGGQEGLAKAKRAKSVCTVVLDKDSISGVIQDYELDQSEKLVKLKVQAPCLVNNTKLLHEDTDFEFEEAKTVTSVYGGPSSFEAYPEFEDFATKRISKNPVLSQDSEALLKKIREYREQNIQDQELMSSYIKDFFATCPEHWLAGLELYEISKSNEVKAHLIQLKSTSHPDTQTCIDLGLDLA